PGVVESEEVIGMMMRERDGVHLANPLAQKLQPHLGRGVDQEVAPRQANQHAGPCSMIPGIPRSAHRAVASDHGDTGGGPGSKKDQAAPRGRIGITQSSHPPPPGTFSKLIRTVESLHLTKNEPERRAPGAVRLRRVFAATGRSLDN